MHTTSTTLLSLLPLLAATSPVLPRANTQSAPFTLIAAHSGSPIHLQSINAASSGFYIGKATSAYCPDPPVTACPPDNITAVIVDSYGSGIMDSEVPGGQVVFVPPSGALSFTPAHEEIVPANASSTNFAYANNTAGALGRFSFTGFSSQGWLACPAKTGGAYQVFADVKGLSDKDVPGGNKTACLGFDALGSTYERNSAAWEYV